ncbi:MAG TPA: FAD-binding protein, partial [Candidatus Paceibacterota bacterium]|nr:FAD-binding protein [Candidatus Paceibacterota bacterium]
MNPLESQHADAVASLAEKVKEFNNRGEKVRIYHGGTNSTRRQKFEPARVIDTSNLNRVIFIDVEKKYVLVEPNVSMEQLVSETLKHSLIPPVIMEFPNITVGGGVQGGAGESSSFKW